MDVLHESKFLEEGVLTPEEVRKRGTKLDDSQLSSSQLVISWFSSVRPGPGNRLLILPEQWTTFQLTNNSSLREKVFLVLPK
jgi:hypothetical protein